jgi:outer membrane immunogenic protein
MRKYLKAVLLGGASAILMASAGHAADQIAVAPAGFNWSGFYVGVGGGFGASRYSSDSFSTLGGGGAFGELTIGYDHMLTDRILLGGFIDAHIGNIGYGTDASVPVPIAFDLTNSYGFDAVARLGYVLNGSTLGYVLGGYTWERFKLDASVPPPVGDFTDHDSSGGYVLGVGMETAIGHNWTIKAEYRYANYGDVTFNAPTPAGIPAGPGLEVSPSTHTFHIAANYRFGAEGTGPAIASPVYDWTGFYVGAAVGAGEVVHKLSESLGPFHVEANGYGTDGVFGELDAGYDHDFGKFVAGIMVDGTLSGISSHDDSAKLKMDYGFDILGRLGMKVNPSTLAYVLGGYSWGHFKAEDVADSIDWSSNGFSVGGGLETAIATNTTLGIEYRYTQYAKEDFDFIPGSELEPSSHTVRVGLKYKFN